MLFGFKLWFRLLVLIFVLGACNAVTPPLSPTIEPTKPPARRTFLIRQEQISMLPAIQQGELLSIEEVPTSTLQRGDILFFNVPGRSNMQILKRLIALPGETLEIRDDKVYVNDEALNEPYIRKPMGRNSPLTTLGLDEYYVLGDNRANSIDSRSFGPISGENIFGRVKQ